jgi:hypothetical protein
VPATATPSPALVLARLQTGAATAPSDPLVQQFSRTLDDLGKKCPAFPAPALANFTINVNQQLAQAGVHESLLNTLNGVDSSIPPGAQAGPCQTVFANYVALRLRNASASPTVRR